MKSIVGVMKLVMGFHHMSLKGDQEKLRDGRASMWALSYKFRT